MAGSRYAIGKWGGAILVAALVMIGLMLLRLGSVSTEDLTVPRGVDDWAHTPPQDHHGPTTWTSPSRDVVVYTTVGSDMGHMADASRADSFRSFGGGRYRGLWFNEAIAEREVGLFLVITFPRCGPIPDLEAESFNMREPVNAYTLLSPDRDVEIDSESLEERRAHLIDLAARFLF